MTVTLVRPNSVAGPSRVLVRPYSTRSLLATGHGDGNEAQQMVAHRRRLNVTARTHHQEALHVVLYALTLPGGDPDDDLAACQGHAITQRLVVVDRISDTTTDATGASDPTLRRGYARLLQNLADSSVPVHGVVAASRTSITTVDRLYLDQLTWYAAHQAGLWLIRSETGL